MTPQQRLLEAGVTCLWANAFIARHAEQPIFREGARETLAMIAEVSPHDGLRRAALTTMASIDRASVTAGAAA